MEDSLKIVEEWRSGLHKERIPYIHTGDSILKTHPYYSYYSYDAFIKDQAFGDVDHRFHLNLFPAPYSGSIEHAKIYILMLNPGFAPIDYYAQQYCSPFFAAIKNDVYQEEKREFPFTYLDPEFAWTGGGQYWYKKLNDIIQGVKTRRRLSFRESVKVVSESICTLEMFPYHSKHFNVPKRIIDQMETPKMMKRFIKDYVLKRTAADQACLIVTRGNNFWNINKGKNIAIYSGTQARGAHLNQDSSGGQLMNRFLDQ
jgi:hypothetical protein